MLATMLPSHAENDAATQGCTGYSNVTQPPSSEHRGVVASRRNQIFMLDRSREIAGKIS
jgi:hypothetical protein